MKSFKEIKDRIASLSRAEYRYDRLTSDFAEHYSEMVRANYKPLPNIEAFRCWLRHLIFEIRPGLLEAWQAIAACYGFALGDKITVEGVNIYVVKISCYPLEDIVRFHGFGVKKDGQPSQSSVTVEVQEQSVVQKHGRSLDAGTLRPLYFEGTTRVATAKTLLTAETAELISAMSNQDGSNFSV